MAHFTAHEHARARDEAERRAVRALGVQMAGGVVVFVVGYVLLLLFTRGWLLPVLAQAGFVALLAYQTLVGAPRWRATRLSWARANAPQAYATELKRLRRAPWAMALGAACQLPPALLLMSLRPLWG